MHPRAVAIASLGCCAATGLRMLWPDWSGLAADLSAVQDWTQRVGADQAAGTLAGAALWLVCAWLCVGLAACLASRLPGAGGRAADALAALVLPRALYRMAVGVAGLGVLAGSVAAAAQPVPAGPAAAVLPTPVWPTSTLPAPALPVQAAPPTAKSTAPPAARPATVVVRRGDSLWRIAAAHLPRPASSAQVAAAWPRWFAANRTVIGPDPGHITPGQVLRGPAGEETG